MIRWASPIAALALLVSASAATSQSTQSDWPWSIPGGVAQPRVPPDNPMSEARFQLGRHLFYDPRLSANASVSCASCHKQELAFSDGRKLSIGATGEPTTRNAQGLANVAWNATYTWANPSLVSLERQMEVPLYSIDPIEMGLNDQNQETVLARFRVNPDYRRSFTAAFPGESNPIRIDNIIKAVATFQRGIISFDSKYDQFLARKTRLSAREMRGKRLFFGPRARCAQCHGSINFNDQFLTDDTRNMTPVFHNTGRYNIDGKGGFPEPNRGVFELTGERSDMGKFRAPSLRNVAVTAPYLHDGSLPTLDDVLDFYGSGGRINGAGANPIRSPTVRKIVLNSREKRDLRAFLETLTDHTLLNNPRFANPHQQ